MKALPIGISDFKEMIELDYFYADKTNLINELLTNKAKVTLFTRPRRFGKTLNMSMLYYFFNIKEAEDNKKLFHGLNIEKTEFWKEQGKYPVIFISFKDINASNWNECYNDIKKLMKNIFKKNLYIYESLDSFDKEDFDLIRKKSKDGDYKFSLKFLSQLLYEYYNKKVIILIDEYDTPIISAYANGYYDEAIEFFKNFYSSALKDNEYLQFGIMTGIMRVAKEGIFSGLNNLKVNTILNKKYEDYFGLSEYEIGEALKEYKLENTIDEVKEWYNGYLFGNREIYNPWSILNYLYERELAAYWVNTSDNYLIKEVLNSSSKEIHTDLMNLFNGKKITKYIDAEMSFGDLKGQNSLWTLLLFSGYLTTAEKTQVEGEYILKIPNREIYSFFKKSFVDEFTGNNSHYFSKLLDSLREKNIVGENSSFEELLRKIFLSYISYHDIVNKENFYHVFMLGITVGFEKEYRTYSNIESGKGRPDLILEPINKLKSGYIFEFKVSDSEENLDKKLEEAMKQIEDQKYITLLSENGAINILGIAIAFYGKELKVKYKVL